MPQMYAVKITNRDYTATMAGFDVVYTADNFHTVSTYHLLEFEA